MKHVFYFLVGLIVGPFLLIGLVLGYIYTVGREVIDGIKTGYNKGVMKNVRSQNRQGKIRRVIKGKPTEH